MAKTPKNAYTLGQDTMTNWGNVESQFMNELRKKPTAAANPAELGSLRVGGHSFSTLPEASRQKILGWASSPDFKSSIVDNSQNTVVPPLGAEPAAPAPPASVNTAGIAAKAATDALSAPSAYDVGTTSKYAEWAAKPLQRKFDEQVSGLNREALAQGLWWSGTRGEALGRSVEDYSRGLAEDVIVPLTYKAMEGRANEARDRLDAAIRAGSTQAEVERLAKESEIADKELALKGREVSLKEGEAIGQVRLPSLSAMDLGVDSSQYLNPDGSVKNFDAFSAAAETLASQAKTLLGRDLTPDEARTLALGGSLSNVFASTTEARKLNLETGIAVGEVGGKKTVEERKNFGYDREVTNPDGTVSTEHVYGTNEISILLQKNDQDFEQKMATGFNYEDEYGEIRHFKGRDELLTDERTFATLTRTGYDEPVLGADGKPLMDKEGKPIVRHIEGTQEADVRLREREQELQKEGLAADVAHKQAVLEQDKRQYEGYYKTRSVKWGDLGLGDVPPGVRRPDGSINVDAFNAWAVSAAGKDAYARLTKAIGRVPTTTDIDAFVKGQSVAVRDASGQPITDWVEGTQGLESSKIAMSKELAKMGYDAQEADRIATQAYEDKKREGYYTTDEVTGKKKWIRGTQDDAEYLAKLQKDNNISILEAEARLDEEKRVGYDKVKTHKVPDGKGGYKEVSTVIHVLGTQEAAFVEKNGGYITRKNEEGKDEVVWVDGDQAHQKAMQDDAQELVKAGWKQEEAMEALKSIRSRATEKSAVIKQDFLKARSYYYENQDPPLSPGEAQRKAEADWVTVEGSLGGTLEERLHASSLAEAKELRDDEHRWEMQAAAIGALGSLAQDLGAGGVLKNILGKAFGIGSGGGGVSDGIVDVTADWATDAVLGGSWGSGGTGNAGGVGGGGPTPSAALLNRFGNWLIPGAANYGLGATLVGTAAVALTAYGTYKLVKWMFGKKKKPDMQAIEADRAIFEEETSDLSAENRDAVYRQLQTMKLKPGEFGYDKHLRSIAGRYKDMEQKAFGDIADGVSTLIDNGVFTKTPDKLTLTEAKEIGRLWALLPSGAKTYETSWDSDGNKNTTEGEVDFIQKAADLAAFSAHTGVLGKKEKASALYSVFVSGILESPPDKMTVGDQKKINMLYEQYGGDPTQKFEQRVSLLKNMFMEGKPNLKDVVLGKDQEAPASATPRKVSR